MQSDKIKYTAKYNKPFFTQLIFFQYYKRWSIVLLTLGGIFSLVLGIGYLLGWNPFNFHTFPYFTVFYTLVIIVMPVFLWKKIQKKLENHPFIERPINFEFSEKGIQIHVDNEDKFIAWGQLYRIKSIRNAWVFYGTPHSFFYIVQDEISENNQELLEKWILASSKFI